MYHGQTARVSDAIRLPEACRRREPGAARGVRGLPTESSGEVSRDLRPADGVKEITWKTMNLLTGGRDRVQWESSRGSGEGTPWAGCRDAEGVPLRGGIRACPSAGVIKSGG